MPSRPTVYVTVSHVVRRDRIVPHVDSVVISGDETWHSLVNASTLSVFRVDGVTRRQAPALLLAHLAGHAPVGVERVFDRNGLSRTA